MASRTDALAHPETLAKYEPVIGLEVHVQLATRTKIYCGCPTSFGAPPNTNVCPVCLGLPGALPVLNRRAVEMAVQSALALNCRVNPVSRLARKNYFYPDLPKGYQISQYESPLAEHGWVEIRLDGAARRIGITRVHIEDDAGKSLHEGFRDSDRYTYVDLNRCGTPLIEIVTEPDIRSSEEAYAFLTELKLIMQYLEVSSCDMEKGQLRCDANVSVRLRGAAKFGTKTEVKNLNSFRYLRLALDYEIARQIAILEDGGRIEQETRLYDVASGTTIGMRSKEQAHDYRYFPDPDLVPLVIDREWVEDIRRSLPELPDQRRERYMREYGLPGYDAGVLTASRPMADYYEEAAKLACDPKAVSNWLMGDVSRLMNETGLEPAAMRARGFPLSPASLAELVSLVRDGTISGKMAKDVLEQAW
ncbi:MAG: Asp-tRNA(Asn)/Glu-tRNA(Gln) amidotransferase subunit GatB, partial [Dehalococcoidia bacterium]|nr:Asp-tRNA(Asn)/Glu-tRNA(Gln) amidotransferase subunit GatB [Dehalococcoidia bacterium]